MQKDILINVGAHERRIAVLEDGKLEEFLMERPDKERMVGNIYIGVVQRVHPGMQAAFIDIGMEKAAFLSSDDLDPSGILDPVEEDGGDFRKSRGGWNIGRILRKGQRILVQVAKEPISTKGARVTMQLSFPGRFIVLLSGTNFIGISKKTRDSYERRNLRDFIASVKPENVGIIVRTIGLMAHEEDFQNEINIQYDKYQRVLAQARKTRGGPALIHREIGLGASAIRDLFSHDVTQVIVDSKDEYKNIIRFLKEVDPGMRDRVQLYKGKEPLFDVYGIEREVDKILRRKVWLKTGGYLIFDHAEALVAIDVNSGRFVSGSQENTIFRTNLEAVNEIARQLRLRDIGGLIVIDLIDMDNPKHREQIYHEFCRAMARDKAAHHIGRITEFGLIELSRKRVRPELVQAMSEVCPTCGGTGIVFASSIVVARINRFLNRNRAAGGEKRLQLEVPLALADFLETNKGEALRRLMKDNNSKIELLANEELLNDEFRIYNARTGEDLTEKLRQSGQE